MKGLPKWFWLVTLSTLFAASLPYLFALAIQPEETVYLGVHSNYDDHAVYAAWTKQAQEGRFFFENRFTTDEQPGRTIHLYFLAAGWLAKAVGIPIALHVFRFLFGFLALLALFRLVERYLDEGVRLPAFILGIFAAGVGFFFWRNYGFDGPIDVWQPEAFVFPSLMQNGLFCAALWLILVVWKCILEAKDSWQPVALGGAALLALTNIHTYDTLQIALVGIGFLAAMVGAKEFWLGWLGRALLMALGAVPALGWFVYARSIDPVFASRADTVTISAPIWWVLLGISPALLLAGFGLWKKGNRFAVIGAAGLFGAIGVLQTLSAYRMDSVWASMPLFVGLMVIAVALCWMYRPTSPIYGMLFAWIVVGVIALYYPGLFQRKLAMALALPAGIAAAVGLSGVAALRNMRYVYVLVIAALGATGIFWLARETGMATRNTSNTTMQSIYWPAEIGEISRFFRERDNSNDAVIAMPGIAVPDDFDNPTGYAIAIPDLNPVLSGWGGIKTFAGHWSETPDYLARRQRVMNDLFSQNATAESAYLLMRDSGATYIVAPTSEIAAQARVPSRDFYTGMGEVIYEGDSFVLVRFAPSP
ncbi:MAG: hypothetical protein ABIV13_04880 [Fimbriimonadales bacterium]